LNFLLHRHVARRDLGSPVAAIGAMLPDVWRMADRRVRAQRGLGETDDLHRGIEHHLETDRWFHDAELFVAGEKRLHETLAVACPRTPKMVPLAHVVWEILLDGALVRREGDGFLEGLRRDLGGVAEAELERAADAHHFARVERTAEERDLFHARTRRILAEIARGPWILGYATSEGVLVSLSGVRTRLGLAPVDSSEIPALVAVLDGAAREADAALHAV